MITDTHAHLYWSSFDEDRDEVIARARSRGVSRFVIVGTDATTSRAAADLCARVPNAFPTAGVHPHDASAFDADVRREIEALCRRDECVAVGETGLDYFKEFSPRSAQQDAFRWHIELARALDKPIVVHCRDAHDDTVALLRSVPGVRGVMHCYTMGVDELPPYLELGFYISFSGVVTYPKNVANRAAARAVPADRLVVETDCPYLAPQGERGRRNEPAFVTITLAEVAKLRGVDERELARSTSANATALFRLPPMLESTAPEHA